MTIIKKNSVWTNVRLLAASICGLCVFTLTGFAMDPATPADSSAIINFYNPSNNFLYQPDANVHADEREMRAGLLYDLESKKIVWQKDMNTPYPIASLTKMMVALLTVEDIHAGKMNWTDAVSWTREIIVGKGRKKQIVTENISYSLLDVFKAAMIASNNEAAEQMARFAGGGNLQLFIDRMNTRARELGMNSTFYGNPTGLPSTAKVFDNSASPVDLLVLSLEMIQYNEILQVTGMGYADIGDGRNSSVIRNHNHLTIDYKGEVDGMKTGYTKRAGFCLVATSNKCDHRLISIVLGSRSPNLRNEVVKDMINDYYSSIGLDKLGLYCEAPTAVRNAIAGEPVQQTTHIVKHGEDLASIAYQFNCTPADLKKWNGLRSVRITPGKKLVIMMPVNENNTAAKFPDEDSEEQTQLVSSNSKTTQAVEQPEISSPKATAGKTKTKAALAAEPRSKYIIYVVQPGDTLFSIAKRYDVSNIAQLKAVNRISNHHLLRVGAKIKVPVNS